MKVAAHDTPNKIILFITSKDIRADWDMFPSAVVARISFNVALYNGNQKGILLVFRTAHLKTSCISRSKMEVNI